MLSEHCRNPAYQNAASDSEKRTGNDAKKSKEHDQKVTSLIKFKLLLLFDCISVS